MAKSTNIVRQKKRGRPLRAASPGQLLSFRATDDEIAQIDEWSKANGYAGRSAAIRAMIEVCLGTQPSGTGTRHRGQSKSAKLAAQAIDALTDQTAPADELAQRKRRLVKGPKEFRDIRADQPKRKGRHR